VNRALLDTSFVIALAHGEEITIEAPPAEAAISAVSLCGLHHGVLIANDEQRPAASPRWPTRSAGSPCCR
jgi:hypothetical protein